MLVLKWHIAHEFYRSGNEYIVCLKFDVYSYELIVLELLSDESRRGDPLLFFFSSSLNSRVIHYM